MAVEKSKMVKDSIWWLTQYYTKHEFCYPSSKLSYDTIWSLSDEDWREVVSVLRKEMEKK